MLPLRVLARIAGYSMPKWACASCAAARRMRVMKTMLGGDVLPVIDW